MSKIGNIKLSYLKQFNIAIANTYSNILIYLEATYKLIL